MLGDIGPFGGFLEPVGDMDGRMLAEYFRQQAGALYAGGADAIIIETMSDPMELSIAVNSARQVSYQPVIATYAFSKGDGIFRTMFGTTVADAITAARQAGAAVVGANCGTSLSLEDNVELARQLVQAAEETPVIIQPNAGSPALVDGKLVHPATPQDMAAIVPKLLALGVKIIGGCCGTSPAHLEAMAAKMPK